MEKRTFRIGCKNRLRLITDKSRENGGMNSVQNWRNMRDRERWIFCIERYNS